MSGLKRTRVGQPAIGSADCPPALRDEPGMGAGRVAPFGDGAAMNLVPSMTVEEAVIEACRNGTHAAVVFVVFEVE